MRVTKLAKALEPWRILSAAVERYSARAGGLFSKSAPKSDNNASSNAEPESEKEEAPKTIFKYISMVDLRSAHRFEPDRVVQESSEMPPQRLIAAHKWQQQWQQQWQPQWQTALNKRQQQLQQLWQPQWETALNNWQHLAHACRKFSARTEAASSALTEASSRLNLAAERLRSKTDIAVKKGLRDAHGTVLQTQFAVKKGARDAYDTGLQTPIAVKKGLQIAHETAQQTPIAVKKGLQYAHETALQTPIAVRKGLQDAHETALQTEIAVRKGLRDARETALQSGGVAATSLIESGKTIAGKMGEKAEEFKAETIGKCVPGKPFQFLSEDFKPSVTSPYKKTLMYSLDPFRGRFAYVESLAEGLNNLDGWTASEDPLEAMLAVDGFVSGDSIVSDRGVFLDGRLEDAVWSSESEMSKLDLVSPTIEDAPTRWRRMKEFVENLVETTKKEVEAVKSEWKIKSADDNNNNKTADDGNESKNNETDVNGWRLLRENIDVVSGGAATKSINAVKSTAALVDVKARMTVDKVLRR